MMITPWRPINQNGNWGRFAMFFCLGFVWLGLGAFVVLGFTQSYRDDL